MKNKTQYEKHGQPKYTEQKKKSFLLEIKDKWFFEVSKDGPWFDSWVEQGFLCGVFIIKPVSEWVLFRCLIPPSSPLHPAPDQNPDTGCGDHFLKKSDDFYQVNLVTLLIT